MEKDKVMHPTNQSRSGIKNPKTAVVEGPTPSLSNLTPYNRKGGKK